MKLSGFPSPCGDYGSYRDHILEEKRHDRKLFPSPCGDYGSYPRARQHVEPCKDLVSVPLRGLWFLSLPGIGQCRSANGSFRPLAGIMVLIMLDADADTLFDEEFPSPCGDYGSYPHPL